MSSSGKCNRDDQSQIAEIRDRYLSTLEWWSYSPYLLPLYREGATYITPDTLRKGGSLTSDHQASLRCVLRSAVLSNTTCQDLSTIDIIEIHNVSHKNKSSDTGFMKRNCLHHVSTATRLLGRSRNKSDLAVHKPYQKIHLIMDLNCWSSASYCS